jgi:hypothetical protein
MRKSIDFSARLFSVFLLLAVALCATESRAQDAYTDSTTLQLRPYGGIGLLFASYSNAGDPEYPGYEVEAGLRYKVVYAGVEFARSGTKSTTINYSGSPSQLNADYATNAAILYGGHAGVTFLNSTLSIGAVVIASSQSVAHTVNHVTTTITSNMVSYGPDIRLQVSEHFLLSAQYTYHLGSKIGVDYIF